MGSTANYLAQSRGVAFFYNSFAQPKGHFKQIFADFG